VPLAAACPNWLPCVPGLFCEPNPGPPPPLADDPAMMNKTTATQGATPTAIFSETFNFILSANPLRLVFNVNCCLRLRRKSYARIGHDVEPFLGQQAAHATVPLSLNANSRVSNRLTIVITNFTQRCTPLFYENRSRRKMDCDPAPILVRHPRRR